jgi:hypothetical protein
MKELRELAGRASKGPWKLIKESPPMVIAPGVCDICTISGASSHPGVMADAAYIAAISPDVVLGLLDRIEALEKGLRECADYIEMDMREHGLRPDYADTNAVNRARSLLKEQA